MKLDDSLAAAAVILAAAATLMNCMVENWKVHTLFIAKMSH